MLYRQHLISELHARREAFVTFERTWGAEVRAYARRLRALAGRSAQAIRETTQAQQQARAAHKPNALPTDELERASGFVVPFDVRWRAHEEARS
ncbi:MAG TPA: hypothetical protein VE821_11265, partial [Pyrinomonadaceae bacterium]|nr:hypothetical protein [Pyrinomonadaceae bacterium]